MPEVFEGKHYVMYESINFDEYMTELGVIEKFRRLGNKHIPTISLKKNGNIYTLTTETAVITSIIEFELGKPFNEITFDHREIESVITLEGNKLIHKHGGKRPTEIIREFGETHMTATMTAGDVVCIRRYRV